MPNILMGLGSLLIVLAFVQKIGTYMELPRERQRFAAIAGAGFLGLGVAITVAPHIPPSPRTPVPTVKNTNTSEAHAAIRSAVEGAVASEPAAVAAESSTSEIAALPHEEPIYTGNLEALMPDIKLLPDDMRFFSRDTRISTSGCNIRANRSGTAAVS